MPETKTYFERCSSVKFDDDQIRFGMWLEKEGWTHYDSWETFIEPEIREVKTIYQLFIEFKEANPEP